MMMEKGRKTGRGEGGSKYRVEEKERDDGKIIISSGGVGGGGLRDNLVSPREAQIGFRKGQDYTREGQHRPGGSWSLERSRRRRRRPALWLVGLGRPL